MAKQQKRKTGLAALPTTAPTRISGNGTVLPFRASVAIDIFYTERHHSHSSSSCGDSFSNLARSSHELSAGLYR